MQRCLYFFAVSLLLSIGGRLSCAAETPRDPHSIHYFFNLFCDPSRQSIRANMARLKEDFVDSKLVNLRLMALPMSDDPCDALLAKSVLCADALGAGLPYLAQALMANNDKLVCRKGKIRLLAKAAGAPVAAFSACLDGPKGKALLALATAEYIRLRCTGFPSIMLGEEELPFTSYDKLEPVLQRRLAE